MSRPEHRAEEVRFIHRHRLEKKDPTAEISDPVEPIIYWIDPATPEWIRPWIIDGGGQVAARLRGGRFLQCHLRPDGPHQGGGPGVLPQDARHSVIYWRPSTVANATGGQIVDPRSGEIIKGEVNMYHNIMELQKNWYFVQVAPLDERAQSLPMPDSLMARLVEYVVTHEIGHAIGFPHNMKAVGPVPGGLDPEPRVPGADERSRGHPDGLLPLQLRGPAGGLHPPAPAHPPGRPYDHFAVRWGYRPIPEARTPDEELPTLDAWAREQEQFPWLRFSTPGATADPEAPHRGGGRCRRRPGHPARDAEPGPGRGLADPGGRGSRAGTTDELEHPLRAGGGAVGPLHGARGRHRGRSLLRGDRRAGSPLQAPGTVAAEGGLEYLSEAAFQVPEMFLDPEILRRIETQGVLNRFRGAQGNVLNSLFQPGPAGASHRVRGAGRRSRRRLHPGRSHVRPPGRGLGRAHAGGSVRVNPYRRNLQRAYLNAAHSRLNPTEAELTRAFNPVPQPWASDVRGMLRAELQDLDQLAQQALGGPPMPRPGSTSATSGPRSPASWKKETSLRKGCAPLCARTPLQRRGARGAAPERDTQGPTRQCVLRPVHPWSRPASRRRSRR
jgi:hypothetical protein